jgi:uncharacterized protein (TIGR03437 family)
MQVCRRLFSVTLLTFLAIPVGMAQSTDFLVVNAAGYGNAIAPDSLATIFGSNVASATASATLDANGRLPTELAATRVEFNGVAAPLYYVSPGQINLVVPGGLTPGTASVVIRSAVSGSTKNGVALVIIPAPGVFTSDGSGAGPGAILNAVTYAPAPFVVQTAENEADTRTRIAVYCTGVRHANLVTAQVQDTVGNRILLRVEFAGAAPGFFGLDQVNLLLPPELDGAGTVLLTLTADGRTANAVTFQMNPLPASALRFATLTLSPSIVNAGDSATLTVGLNGVARQGGFTVALRSSTSAAQVNPVISIPEGRASADTLVTTSSLTAIQTAIITGQAGGVLLTVGLEIDPPNTVELVGLSVAPSSILGGRNVTGTVTLSGNAPAGGFNVLISSDSDRARPPAVVNVPFGRSSVDFPIETLAVASAQTVTLTATTSRNIVASKVTLLPPLQLSLEVSTIVGGGFLNGTVTLGNPAPVTGAIIVVQSGDAGVRIPPVTIAAGQNSQTFTITTSPVGVARTATITASYGGLSQSVFLTLTPPPPPTLATLTITPDHVVGGTSTTATATLDGSAGAGGVQVELRSSSVITATAVPSFVVILQGQNSASFTIMTNRFPGLVTFTATSGGVSKTATLTVQ